MVCAGARSFWRPREAWPSPPPKEAANKYISIVYAPEAAGPSSNLQGGQTLRAPAQTSCLLSQRPQEAKGLAPASPGSPQINMMVTWSNAKHFFGEKPAKHPGPKFHSHSGGGRFRQKPRDSDKNCVSFILVFRCVPGISPGALRRPWAAAG